MFTRERLTRWTNSLRENAHRAGQNCLVSEISPGVFQFCALGELCRLEGLKHVSYKCQGETLNAFIFPSSKNSRAIRKGCGLFGDLRDEFGNTIGEFVMLRMPDLVHCGVNYDSVTVANDALVPWSVIADHLDRHYPCSDEAVTD